MITEGWGIVSAGIFVLFWFIGFSSAVNAFVHMNKMTDEFQENRQWGKYCFFSVLTPSFFTEKGNYHRTKVLRHTGILVLSFLIAVMAAFWNETYQPENAGKSIFEIMQSK